MLSMVKHWMAGMSTTTTPSSTPSTTTMTVRLVMPFIQMMSLLKLRLWPNISRELSTTGQDMNSVIVTIMTEDLIYTCM